MNSLRRIPPPWVISAIAVGMASALASGAQGGPIVQLSPSAVAASGVTPGGGVVLIGACRGRTDWTASNRSLALGTTDADGDGWVSFDPGGDIADRSIWGVFDLESGSFEIEGPAGFDPVQVPFDAGAVLKKPLFFEDPRQSLDLVVVRPGVGAWYSRAFDGAAGDHGGADDGAVLVAMADLEWLITDPSSDRGMPLDRLRSGDLVVGIDPIRLEYFSITLSDAR